MNAEDAEIAGTNGDLHVGAAHLASSAFIPGSTAAPSLSC
jgi:hypothetical protein